MATLMQDLRQACIGIDHTSRAKRAINPAPRATASLVGSDGATRKTGGNNGFGPGRARVDVDVLAFSG
jgi:hypothetical protein